MKINTLIDKNTINNTTQGARDGQSLGPMLNFSLYKISPSITLIHSSANLTTKLILQTQFL